MEQVTVFRLPDVGEGLTEAEVIAWRVRPGDHVDVNDVLVDIETAKSVVELPSPAAGVVLSLEAQPGDVLEVGAALVSIHGQGDGSGAPPTAASPQATTAPVARSTPASDGQEGEAPLVLVGTGPTAAVARRLRLRPRRERPAPPPRIPPPSPSGAPAAPVPVADRRLSAVLGGDPGRLVTEWISVDVTEALGLIDRAKGERRWAGIPITLLVLAAKVLLDQARRHPGVLGTPGGTRRPDLELDLGLVAGPWGSAGAAEAVPLDGWDLRAVAAAIGAADLEAAAQDPGPARSLTVLPLGPGTATAQAGALTLTLGEIRDQPLVERRTVLVRQVARLGITIDPSTLDAAVMADLLARVGETLSDPAMAMAYA